MPTAMLVNCGQNQQHHIATMKIPVLSRLHMSFHEAGHIEAAYLSGATVELAGFDVHGSAVTRVVDEELRSDPKLVACGGIAAELLLFEKGLIVDEHGVPLSQAAFYAQALGHAWMDKHPFYLSEPPNEDGTFSEALFYPSPQGQWPPESDKPFMDYTMTHVAPLLRSRFDCMLTLAQRIAAKNLIGQAEVEAIRRQFT